MGKTNGFMKKTLFALLAVFTAVSFLPKNAEAATVRLDQKNFTLTAGERFTLNIKGTGKKATCTSSNKRIATVTKKGCNVVAKKAGKVTITAKVGNKKLKCKVTVKKAPAKPYLTATSKTLRVGESFLLIQGQYTDYESTFSYNDHIATIDHAGKVTATGVGTVKVMVNRGQDSQGRYRDYICTINVVAGPAPVCKHQWMDTSKFNSKGNGTGAAYILKTVRSEAYTECNKCHTKFLDDAEYDEHVAKTEHFAGSMTAGGGESHGLCKFNGTKYCSKCGLVLDVAL